MAVAGMVDAPSSGDTADRLAHVEHWIFDLDNTLYPRAVDLFAQMDRRMTAYVARTAGLPEPEARLLQKALYRDHGTTLAGLMERFGIDPLHYLADVHDIDYSVVVPHPELGRAIAALPGAKHLFTNGDIPHAEKTLAALGFDPVFDHQFDIVAAGYAPKPARVAFERFLESSRAEAARSAMFEDLSRNLVTAKELGMATVLVVPVVGTWSGGEDWERVADGSPHIDHITDDLHGFLVPLGRQP